MLHIGLPFAVLALVAGAGSEPPSAASQARPDDLQFSVAAENVGAALVIKCSIKSKRLTRLTVGYGGCFSHNVRVRLYPTPERKPPVVWDSADNQPVCIAVLLVLPLSPHDSISPRELAGEVSAGGLPKSVPDGTYFATADIRLWGDQSGSGEIAAGSIVVARRAREIIVAPFGTPASP